MLSVDEAMIPFQIGSCLKQFRANISVKRGVKIWCLVGSENGYMHKYNVFKHAAMVLKGMLYSKQRFNGSTVGYMGRLNFVIAMWSLSNLLQSFSRDVSKFIGQLWVARYYKSPLLSCCCHNIACNLASERVLHHGYYPAAVHLS